MTDKTERELLLDDANELGLEFPSNIKTEKLKAMVDEATNRPPPVDEIPPENPAVIPDEYVEKTTIQTLVGTKPALANKAKTAKTAKEKRLARKRNALKTKVITLTNKDVREADSVTSVTLSMENQFFSVAKIVPLDVPIELETALIKVAESTNMTLHRDEIVNGQRTGNKVAVTVKKFAISYGKQNTEE